MKFKMVALAAFVMLGIPWLICRSVEYWLLENENEETVQLEETKDTVPLSEPPEKVYEIPVLIAGDEPVMMPMEEYLVGVLLGEMPVSFHQEALKAQAVVARTYTIKRNVQSPKHPSGSLCTDSTCCQAYASVASYTQILHTQRSLRCQYQQHPHSSNH